MEIVIKDGVKYTRHFFETESQFEQIILSQYKFIFGDNAILFDKQKIRTATGIGTIPDAFIISPDKLKWYIIEVELASHNVYQHVIPQITRFKNALENIHNRKALVTFFDRSIEDDLTKLAGWISATDDKNVFRLISEILDEEPELIIIIDDQNEELEIASKNLPFNTRINIFKTFCRDGFGLGDNIFQFDILAVNKKITKEKIRLQQTVDIKDKNGELRKKASSPSAVEWAQQIPELSGMHGLSNWTDICNHYKLNYEGNSARRVLKAWVKKINPIGFQYPMLKNEYTYR